VESAAIPGSNIDTPPTERGDAIAKMRSGNALPRLGAAAAARDFVDLFAAAFLALAFLRLAFLVGLVAGISLSYV
jgi:hypothetical protein